MEPQASDAATIVGTTDVIEADLRHAQSRLPGAKNLTIWLTAMVVFLLVYLGLRPEGIDRHVVLTMGLPMVFVVVLTVYLQVVGRRAWLKQALTNVGGPTTFRFDDYGFSSESQLRQHRLAWASLSRAVQTPEAFLVYTTPLTVLIIPKRAFSDVQAATVGRWLVERIIVKPSPPTGGLRVRGTLLLWVVLIVTFLSIWHFLSVDDARPQRKHGRREIASKSAAQADDGGEASDVDSSP
jgi:hypothetical protein